ncbi:PemK-like, MazF-like toxin of type II toxin-antitoxin system [Paenibacillus sp. OK060]|uniref:type II toxin-antitoxin system PemK/MazF family toxin n=1 Tax=Paenibacillus sp. OK060 TaxID=1881034 RepID=UPI000891E5CE|nr:type II toxin-antitoxin system PemK/MazF family toxin [Paenibacillus sp. OK060]SDM16663.1 PemK-like, MazF-like toxin of type II toxin-antitoxin system [Paenibacillus sp. OK060]
MTAKTRKIVVLSNDDLNNSSIHSTVMIAKIISIEDYEKEEDWYHLTIEGSHPFFVHLDEGLTGKECYIDMASITTIHKNLLFQEKFDLGARIMAVVSSRLDYCFNLGLYRHSIAIGNTATGNSSI